MTDELEKPFRLITEYTIEQNSSLEKSFRLTLIVGDISDLDPVAPQYVLGLGFNSLSFASTKLAFTQFIKPSGLSFQSFGVHKTYNLLQKIASTGFNAQAFGTASIINKNQEAKPLGFNVQAFGTSKIYNSLQYLIPSSFNTQAFGKPHMLGGVRWVIASGFSSMVFGKPTVISLRRYLDAGGQQHSVLGTAQIEFKNRPLHMVGKEFSAIGLMRIEHSIRTLNVSGFMSSRHSNDGRISLKNRTIAPESIAEQSVGRHLIGREQRIGVQGFDASSFGKRIIPEIQTITTLGFTGVFGQHDISLKKRYIQAKGFLTAGNEDAQRWGYAKVWNTRQYIIQTFIHDSGLVPPDLRGWTMVFNRNRILETSGFIHNKFGLSLFENKARILGVSGFSAFAINKGMIADRVRRLRLTGIEAPYIGRWNIVYNDAFVIGPKGIKSDTFGNLNLENTRRYYNRIGNFESQVFGTAFIADKIRTIRIEPRHSIAPPSIRLPEVHLNTRYIEAVGQIDSLSFGRHEGFERWTKIAPKWIVRDNFGYPELRNATPELHLFGHDSQEFGNSSIRTQWRDVYARGLENTQWGKPDIAFRDRAFAIGGFHTLHVGAVKVIKTAQPPFTEQRIWLDSVELDGQTYGGHGIKPPLNQVSRPGLNQNVLYPSGFFRGTFGAPSVRSNVIQIQSGIQVLEFGTTFVGNKNRNLGVHGINNSIEVSRPRLSPNMIYAVMEAPAQAIQNHPVSGRLHYVNSDGGTRKAGEVFGQAVITHRHRVLSGVGLGSQGIAGTNHNIFNRKHYIGIKGMSSLRSGWHIVGPFEQELEQFESADHYVSGRPMIQHKTEIGISRISPQGMNASVFGANRIELFNRSLNMTGFNSMRTGTALSGDKPFMWQGLRVGALVKGAYGGFNAERFGQTMISLKIRELRIEGFESFDMQYDYTKFNQRMRVTRKDIPIAKQTIGVVGFENTHYGVPNISNKAHYIRPYGNGDNYRKGAPDAD